MTQRGIEYSKLAANVIGRILNKEKKEVRQSYAVDNLAAVLESFFKGHTELKNAIVDIPEASSKKYQKIGIDKIATETQNNVKFFHLSLAYIKRDKENIHTTKVDEGYKTKTIKLLDGEFEYLYLHVSIVPSTGVILLDTKCHNSPTEFALHHIFCAHLDPAKFLLDSSSELNEALRVKIKTQLKDNYEEVLSKRIEQVQGMEFTFVKPTKKNEAISKDLELVQSSEEAVRMCKSLVASIFGADLTKAEFENLPIKRFKLSLTIDDGYDPKEMKSLKKAATTNIKELVKNRYLKNSVLAYQDEGTEQIQKALLRGLQISRPNELEPEYFLDDDKMWEEHRRVYFLVQNELVQ